MKWPRLDMLSVSSSPIRKMQYIQMFIPTTAITTVWTGPYNLQLGVTLR